MLFQSIKKVNPFWETSFAERREPNEANETSVLRFTEQFFSLIIPFVYYSQWFPPSNMLNQHVSFLVEFEHSTWSKHCPICSGNPGWSPRANQRWTALFQGFYKFQRWSALFQNGLRKPALISAVSELFSASFLWISVVQRWIKTNWETDENASCKFEKVLGSRKTCFLECTSYEKIIPAKFQSKIRIDAPASSSCFLIARDL